MFETKYKRRHYGARLISAYQLTHDRQQAEELVTHLKSRFGEHTVSLRYSNLLVTEIPDRLEICRTGKLAVTVHVNEWLVMEERQPLRVLADQAFHEQFEAVDPKNIVTLTVNSFVDQSKGSDEMQTKTYKAKDVEFYAVQWDNTGTPEQKSLQAGNIVDAILSLSPNAIESRFIDEPGVDSHIWWKTAKGTGRLFAGQWLVRNGNGDFCAMENAFFESCFAIKAEVEEKKPSVQPAGEGMPKRRLSLTLSTALERAVNSTRSHANDIVRALEEPGAVGSIRDVLVEQIDADREAADVLEGWLKRDGHPFITQLEPGERGSKEVGYIKRQRGY